MSDFLLSLIRTYVPIAVGAVLGYLTAKGINIPDDVQIQASIAITGLLQALYYGLIRALEKKWPKIGILLGSTATPSYDK